MPTDFTLVDGLVLFGALPLWLLVGHIFVKRLPNLVRYTWGVLGGGAVAVVLFAQHGLERLVWLPVLGAGAGLGATALIYLVDGLRAIVRYHQGGGDVFHPVFIERLLRAWAHREGGL